MPQNYLMHLQVLKYYLSAVFHKTNWQIDKLNVVLQGTDGALPLENECIYTNF